jgi:hypothetical protein
MDKSDWNEYAGCPNEFFAAPGDRILHREIPEQEEEFWNDFLEGRNGKGFSKIDCPENRETLLQKHAAATGYAPVVRSVLNELWRKYAITRGAFDHGFIDPNPESEIDDRPRDAEGRQLSQTDIQQQAWIAWLNDPETSTRAIEQKKRTDASFAAFYRSLYVSQIQSDDPMVDTNVRNNMRQPAPSTITPTSRKVASPEVQRFAAEYIRMSTEQVKKLLSPVLNQNGPADAARQQTLFEEACKYGLV